MSQNCHKLMPCDISLVNSGAEPQERDQSDLRQQNVRGRADRTRQACGVGEPVLRQREEQLLELLHRHRGLIALLVGGGAGLELG